MNDKTINTEVTMRDDVPAGGAKRFRAGDEILGRYVVESELGQGGMGVVYLCLDKVGGVKVAVKGLPPEVSHNSDEMESVRDNFRLVSELQHPNIAGVRTLERDAATGDYYLVMAYARGVSLKQWIRQHGGKEHRAEQLNVLRQIASALDYAHNAEPKHIIHRDIKPENVMVDEHGNVSVLDFGLAAQVRSSMSRVSQVVTSRSGTPAYKSPEQWLAQAQRAPSDQYSLGVIAYQMFAGELPFDSDDLDILKHAVAFDSVPVIPDESKAVNAVLAKVLSKKPQDRFPTCGDFVAALAGERVSLRGVRRPGIGAILLALLGLAAVIGAACAVKVLHDRSAEKAALLRGLDVMEVKAGQAYENSRCPEYGEYPELKADCQRLEACYKAGINAHRRGDLSAARDFFLQVREVSYALRSNLSSRVSSAAKAKAPSANPASRRRPAQVEATIGRSAPVRLDSQVDLPLGAGVTLSLLKCPSGSFDMGSPRREPGRRKYEEPHGVVLTDAYWLGRTEVTQGQWRHVMGGETVLDLARKAGKDSPGSHCGDVDDQVPVYWVSYADAQAFCGRLTEIAQSVGLLPDGYVCRLPTEAEWEFACRAGTATTLPSGQELEILDTNCAPNLDGIAWYGGNSSVGYEGVSGWDTISWKGKQYPCGKAAPRRVATRTPNRWGFYDMIGNVCEWCHDYFDVNYERWDVNPVGRVEGVYRVVRGGGWSSRPGVCRSACRMSQEEGPKGASNYTGFRVCMGRSLTNETALATANAIRALGHGEWARGLELAAKADPDDPDILAYRAYCLDCGYAIEKNAEKANGLYRKAAQKGSRMAAINLALNLQNGVGCEKNPEEAFRLLSKVAELDNTLAMRCLAGLYESGEGVKQDLGKAIEWYEKALKDGDEKARKELERVKGKSAAAGTGTTRSLGASAKRLVGQWRSKFSVAKVDLKNESKSLVPRLPRSSPLELACNEDGTARLVEREDSLFGDAAGHWTFRHGVLTLQLENDDCSFELSGSVSWRGENAFELKLDNVPMSVLLRKRCADAEELVDVKAEYENGKLALRLEARDSTFAKAVCETCVFRREQ